jgi:hypothetical protein
MTADVGRSHYIEPHMDSARLVNALCCFAFPECLACVTGQQAAGKEPRLPALPIITKIETAKDADETANDDGVAATNDKRAA